MAIIDQVQLRENASGKLSLKKNKRIRTYREEFWIYASQSDDEVAVLFGVDQGIGDFHPSDEGAWVIDKEVTREKEGIRHKGVDCYRWLLRVEYSNDSDKTGSGNPLMEPAKIGYGFQKVELPVYMDIEEEPIVNKAKDPFDPPLTADYPFPIKTIQINLDGSTFNPSWMLDYASAVNSGSYDGWEAGQVIVDDISASPESFEDEEGNTVEYYSVTIKLLYNPFGWQPHVMSVGYRELDDDDNKVVITINGRELSTPLPLDSAGKAIKGDDISTAYFHDFKIYREVSFSIFNF